MTSTAQFDINLIANSVSTHVKLYGISAEELPKSFPELPKAAQSCPKLTRAAQS